MNTEKIEKLKKTLNSTKLPADLKPKIEAEIKRLEDLDAKESEAKEEVKPVAKKTTTRKPRATKTVAKKTSTRKPSQTSKPKRTPMSLAKEIRKEGESWSDARARASKMMKEKTHTATKDVESELDKLTKLVRSKKELKGQVYKTDLLRDAKRKAKPRGARKVTHSGETSNQYGTYKNHLGRKYYESRAEHSDRGTFGKYHLAEGGAVDKWIGYDKDHLMNMKNGMIVLRGTDLKDIKPKDIKGFDMLDNKGYADGGYLTDPNFGNFQNTMFAKGGGVRTINGREYSYGRNWTNDHNLTNKGEEHEVNYTRKKRFELGGTVVTDLAGHTGGGTGGLNAGMPLDGFSNTAYTGLVGETGAMSSGEMFMAGGKIKDNNYHLTIVQGDQLIHIKMYNKPEERKDYGNKLQSLLMEVSDYGDMDVVTYTTPKNIDTESKFYEWWKNNQDKLDNYELGGGLPSGVSQSYMITESLGNPAQHFAKGGGIRRVGGREYPLGRNWTNDHEHTNKAEEHEVNYTRKGKFLGVFADGGEIYAIAENMSDENYNKKYNSLSEKQKNKVNILIRLGDTPKLALATVLYGNFENDSDSDTYKLYTMAKGGGVRRVGNREYSLGRNWTNDHEHVNKAEEHETKYTRKKSFAGGGAIGETPKIYVADLEAYNNGRLSGVWLDLADYNDADELMEAIQDFLKTSGGEEYAIHDAEYIPSSMYSEYMGQKDFEELYEMIDLAKDNNLPLSVVQEVVSQYDASAVEDFYGKYDDAEDFAQQLVDDIGIESFTDFQYYLEVSDTDRRLLSQEMADSYVDDIRDEDGGNRLIEEAGLDVDEYEEADSDRQEEMLDEAREIVYDEYYNNWYEGLSDPYYFLVEEQGMYSPDDFANANFVRVDYERLGEDLEQDYTFIYDDGELYVFNIR